MAVAIDRKFEYIVQDYYQDSENADANSRFSALLSILHEGISTMREAIRLKNALRLKLPILKEHIDAMDIVALELLRVKDPSILQWIRQKGDILLLNGEPNDPIYAIQIPDLNELENAIDSRWGASGRKASTTSATIEYLFTSPRSRYEKDGANRSRAQLDKRVLDRELFELYLTSDVDSEILQAGLINFMIKSADAKSLIHYIGDAARSGKYLYAVESIASIGAPSDAMGSESIATAIANTIHLANRSTLRDSECARAIDVFEKAALDVPEPTRDDAVKKLFASLSDEDTICMADFIIRQERAYERHGFAGDAQKIISEEALDELESDFSLGMSFMYVNGGLIRLPYLFPQITLWKNVDPDLFCEFAKQIDICPSMSVILAEGFLGTWHPLGQSEIASYSLHEELFSYATREALQKAEEELVKNMAFWELPFGTQRKLAALNVALERGVGSSPYDEINIEEADERLDEWRVKYEKASSFNAMDFSD